MDARRTVPAAAPEAGPEAVPDPISRRLPALLNRVVSVLLDGAAADFRDLGISIPAIRALICIHEGGGAMTVGAVAEATSMDLSTTSHVLRRLEIRGLVTRRRAATDNRIVHAALTPSGGETAAACHAASLRHEAILVGDMPPQDVARLKDVLVQVHRNARAGFLDIKRRREPR